MSDAASGTSGSAAAEGGITAISSGAGANTATKPIAKKQPLGKKASGVIKAGGKAKAKPSHPSTADMVVAAIGSLKERGGSSLQAIKKYITVNYKVDAEKLAPFIKKYVKAAVTTGALVQTKGKGASGSFKLPSGEKSSKSTVGAARPKVKKSAALKKVVSSPVAAKKKAVKKAKKAAAVSASPKTAVKPKAKSTSSPAKSTAAKKVAPASPKKVSKAKSTKAPPTKPKTPKPKKTKPAPKAKSTAAAAKKAAAPKKK